MISFPGDIPYSTGSNVYSCMTPQLKRVATNVLSAPSAPTPAHTHICNYLLYISNQVQFIPRAYINIPPYLAWEQAKGKHPSSGMTHRSRKMPALEGTLCSGGAGYLPSLCLSFWKQLPDLQWEPLMAKGNQNVLCLWSDINDNREAKGTSFAARVWFTQGKSKHH